jgi:hypothetical protein
MGTRFRSRVISTFVNGRLVYNHGIFDDGVRGMRLERARA